MIVPKTLYLLDAGNTQLKLAFVEAGVIQWVKRFSTADFAPESIDGNIPVIFSSVISEKDLEFLHPHFLTMIELKRTQKLPFEMAYESPNTLGLDRLCNAAALAQLESGRPRLAIDLGTCIKCDFVDENGRYLGGSISPGLQMRSKAMATFTAKLPEVNLHHHTEFIGRNSMACLEIGAYFGWQKEIEAYIAAYQTAYPQCYIVLTGGDVRHFDLGQKNGIFANENLTFEGMLSLYQFHE
ncbi:MAG: hypothetical protein RLZZ301_618 [Bacteroidota bacterium]|jgi:type III pantothenate kinase